MAELPVDLRTKIGDEADAVLAAVAQARGASKAEVARDVLHEWAAMQLRVASFVSAHARFKGELRAIQGRDVP